MNKEYWFTTSTGRKVHVLEGESPKEAYMRMYREDVDTGEPYTMEELDEMNFEPDDYDNSLYENTPLRTLRDEDIDLLEDTILKLNKSQPNLFNIPDGASYKYAVGVVKKNIKNNPDIQYTNEEDIAEFIKQTINPKK